MKKIIVILISFLILIFLSVIVYVRMSLPGTNNLNLLLKNNLPKNLYVILRFFKDTDKNVKRNLNDYNVNFLPKTEFLDLKFTKIKINALKKSKSGYLENHLYKFTRKQYSFFIAKHKNFLFLGTADGKIYYAEINKLDNNNFKILHHNLEDDKI